MTPGEIGIDPTAVAVGFEAVWVVDHDDDELLKLDPETARVAEDFPVDGGPVDVAIGSELLWIANATAGTVQAIDPESGEEVDGFPLEQEPVALAISDGIVWAVDRDGNPLVRINEANRRRIGNARTWLTPK